MDPFLSKSRKLLLWEFSIFLFFLIHKDKLNLPPLKNWKFRSLNYYFLLKEHSLLDSLQDYPF
jgi:hypothetical protein